MSDTPKPLAPYETWLDLLLNRPPVLPREWARVEDGMSYAKQFEFARAELAALRERVNRYETTLRNIKKCSQSVATLASTVNGKPCALGAEGRYAQEALEENP